MVFTLQVLHASDQEAGIPALQDAIGLSAVMNALGDDYENSLRLTSGDVFIAGPFFGASADLYDSATSGRSAGQAGLADMLIQNRLGWDAAAVGNHKFDAGDSSFFNMLAPRADWVNGAAGGQGIGPGGYPGALFPYLATNLNYSGASLPTGLTVVDPGGAPLPNTLTKSVAADIHGTFVNNLTYQLAPGGDRIATSAFEVTTGSVAYYPSFGPMVIGVASGLGLLSPQQRAVYDALPIAPDGDDLVNDKDDFLKSAFPSLAIDLSGYDPIGLNTNLPQADGLINATLLQGDYVAAHTYGWTQFDIDASSQKLTVTTYGILPYSATNLASNPEAVLGLTPAIVSQFEVTPDLVGLG